MHFVGGKAISYTRSHLGDAKYILHDVNSEYVVM
jgi:hypothetical protein